MFAYNISTVSRVIRSEYYMTNITYTNNQIIHWHINIDTCVYTYYQSIRIIDILCEYQIKERIKSCDHLLINKIYNYFIIPITSGNWSKLFLDMNFFFFHFLIWIHHGPVKIMQQIKEVQKVNIYKIRPKKKLAPCNFFIQKVTTIPRYQISLRMVHGSFQRAVWIFGIFRTQSRLF